jgi:hypothetical protein
MTPVFVFLHVGHDPTLPTLLVRSLRAQHPVAEIIQCTDLRTERVEGVDMVSRQAGDTGNLMTFRLEGFAALGLRRPAFYLDTDMLCVRPLDLASVMAGVDVAVCRREYHRDGIFNVHIHDLDLSEYDGRTLGEVYPYVACATASADDSFWLDCRQNLRRLHPKFHYWYGDQEAIRNIADSGEYRVRYLPESVYGRLPDEPPLGTPPCLLHFKGEARKALMLETAQRLGLLDVRRTA